MYRIISVVRYIWIYWERETRINKNTWTPWLTCLPHKGWEKEKKIPFLFQCHFLSCIWDRCFAETWQPCLCCIQTCPSDTTVQHASLMVLIRSKRPWGDVTCFGCWRTSCRRMTSCLVIELILDTPEAWWKSVSALSGYYWWFLWFLVMMLGGFLGTLVMFIAFQGILMIFKAFLGFL